METFITYCDSTNYTAGILMFRFFGFKTMNNDFKIHAFFHDDYV